jgi:2'-5' RNA ligase
MPDVELARRTGVELVKTGRWDTMTGSWNPTPEDLAAAVEAQSCPAIRRPVVKLGHVDTRFDGEPALGWFENLRLGDGGSTLLGDQVTLPWLHSVQAAAYPSRSVEGAYRYRCSEGHQHRFVLTAVALLGVTPPAVKTIRNLNDLPAALGVAASETDVPDGAERVEVTIMAADPTPDGDDDDEPTGVMVALIPTAEDAARLVVDGGEPAEQLHVTLAYLGEAADLDAAARQDLIDLVSSAVNGMPTVQAEIFSAAVYNPGDTSDRDTCLVYQVSGDLLDAVHDTVDRALDGVNVAARPWFAHVTAVYTDDLGRLSELVGNVGPVTFDRVRIAIAGQAVDIPLIDNPQPDPDMVDFGGSDDGVYAANAPGGNTDRLKRYWLAGPGLKRWAGSAHPWTALYHALLRYIKDPDEAKRTASSWYREHFGHMPNQKGVKAAADPAPELPAAEPEQPNTDPKEDHVSTELSALRSRLGLDEAADLDAITAAVDELKTKADREPDLTPEMVQASAAATKKAEEAEAEKNILASAVDKLSEQVASISGELAAVKAKEAATVKASVIGDAVREGKIKPADRERWETDYDEAPAVTSRILASIAPGTAVPVMASGSIGNPEPDAPTDGVDADEAAAWAGMWGIPSEELTRG